MLGIGTIFTGLSVGGAVASCVGSVGGTLYNRHRQNMEFNARLDSFENEFHSRIDNQFTYDSSLNNYGVDQR